MVRECNVCRLYEIDMFSEKKTYIFSDKKHICFIYCITCIFTKPIEIDGISISIFPKTKYIKETTSPL